MNIRISFRVEEQRDVDLILGQGKLKAGWHAHKLNAPGTFLVSAPEHDTPRRARAYLVTDDDAANAVACYAATRPQLDIISRHALTAGPSAAPQPSGEPSPGHRAARPDDAGQGEPPAAADEQQDPDAILRRAVRRTSRRRPRQRPHHDDRHEPPVGLLPTPPARRRRLRRPDRTRPLAHREMTIRNRECKVQVHALTRLHV